MPDRVVLARRHDQADACDLERAVGSGSDQPEHLTLIREQPDRAVRGLLHLSDPLAQIPLVALGGFRAVKVDADQGLARPSSRRLSSVHPSGAWAPAVVWGLSK